MAFAFLAIGILMLVAAIRGTQSNLFALVRGDFSGTNNFLYWAIAIIIVGAIGYIPKAKPFSVAILILLILAMIRNEGSGIFSKFTTQVATTQGAATPNANVTTTPGSGATGSSTSNTSGIPSLPNLSSILQ